MTNLEKSLLRHMVKREFSFSEIKKTVGCADSTIRRYMKVFGKPQPERKSDEIKQQRSMSYL